MNRSISRNIRHIAKQEGISEEEVLAEMQRAIDAGYNDSNPVVQAYWEAMPFRGKPTPQELIAYLASKV